MAYQPALDGLRGLAVAAVLLFHGEVSWMGGGYLGVSVFFTLSGFLITRLLIAERQATGRIGVGAFYGRRVRRLLPASTVCVVAVLAVAGAGGFDGVTDLRRDAVGAVLQLFNWVALLGGGSYADLFAQAGGGADPLAHYWSLAIEEQFYWVWPVAFLGLERLARRRRASLSVVLAGLAATFVVVAPVIAALFGPDAAYWATPARVGEILTGAVAAAVVAEGRVPRWARGAAPVALAAVAVAVVTFPPGRGPAYVGLLPALSLVTVVVLLGVQPTTLDAPGDASVVASVDASVDARRPWSLERVLSWPPLVGLGRISYGVYLYHWPLFALLDEGRTGVSGALLLAIRLGATLAAALVSFLSVEQPIRAWRPPIRPTLAAAAVISAAVVGLTLVLPVPTTTGLTGGVDLEAAAINLDGPRASLVAVGSVEPVTPIAEGPPPASLPAPRPSRPVRIVVIGDSTAEATAGGLVSWAEANPSLARVSVVTAPGCGFVLDGARVFPEGDVEIPPGCRGYVTDEVPSRLRELSPDVVMAMTSWDTGNRRWGGGGVEAPTDPGYTERIDRDLAAVTRSIRDAGAERVVWVRQPLADPYWNPVPSPQEDPARHGVLWAAMGRMAAADPGQVRVADVAGWLDVVGLARDHEARPDGVHWSPEMARRLAEDFLGPVLVTEALT